ncbi:DUF3300 domain-containing protein [uncultured Ramlibacter sp.]|uniref:DUF3300 domain-containing protein n=1 Tax=uncultured Ramlibacter sp. TaxID=260755 RepID=UPI00261A0269|nr:DUF3300 domain-containing protein [uncultured Ramlibacter sp.]
MTYFFSLVLQQFGRVRQAAALLAVLAACVAGAAHAQDTTFKTEELDQMLAPIALYPDSLLAQILMASTYPVDVKDAAAWTKANPDAKGDAAVKQVEGQSWDPAVKSLAAFPQVLTMMGAKPNDVQRLGDAFLADPARVMDRVQFLRKKAQEAGNLKSNEQQKVSTQTDAGKQAIIIEPAQPEQVYVPVYQPSVAYGSWMYPSYPPYYWAPPPYYYPGGAFVGGFLWGAAVVGIANGLWGNCNWGGGNVNINVNKFNNVNVNNRRESGNNSFQHNAERRGDVPYRDSKSRENYGRKQADGAQNRESFRGKDGRDAERSRANETLRDRGADPAAGRDKLQGADRERANNAVRDSSNRGSVGDGSRGAGGGDRGGNLGGDGSRGAGNNAFSGARDAGGAQQRNIDRGQASRSSAGAGGANRSFSGGAAGGGARAGGGGGGGRGGGGGGRR